MKILIINGPNLNLLGCREPEIYGNRSFEDYLVELRHQYGDLQLDYFQSNHEGLLLDKLQEVGFGAVDGIVLNAGGYTHTSVALRDCVAAIDAPVVEVHISDITQREAFRHFSYLTDVCACTIMGHGLRGYAEAIDFLSAKF